jgi:ubiquinone/menaquinone biosynthesis C-methylase UbiE
MPAVARWWINRRTIGRARRALARLGPHLRLATGAEVLELGSGGGGMIALLQERYRPSRLVGTDFDPVEVEAARARLARRWGTVPPSVELSRVDALELPFPPGSFDAVFAMMMLHHVEANHGEYVRRPEALKEVARVLRPEGILVYSEMFRSAELRGTLDQLGFRQEFLRVGWKSELAIYRAPS